MKIKKSLLVILSVLFVVIVLIIGYCLLSIKDDDAPRDFQEIEASEVLNVVIEYNSVDYYVSGDTIAGLQHELCQYIENRSGLRVNIQLENNLDICIKGLKDETYDIIARNIPITNENKEFLSFTIPITQNKQVLVQRKPLFENSLLFIRNQIELAGKKIYVPKNSPSILRLQNLSEEIAEPIYIEEIEAYSAEQLIYMVAYEEIDYTVVDKELAKKNMKLFSEIDSSIDISFTQLQAWAVRNSSPILLDSLNIWIEDFKKQKAHHK